MSATGWFEYFDGESECSSTPTTEGICRGRMHGAIVERIQTSEAGTLALAFSNGQRLTLLDSSRAWLYFHATGRNDGSLTAF